MTAEPAPSLLARLPVAGSVVAFVVAVTLWVPNMNRVPYEDALPTILVVLMLSLLVLAGLRPLAGSWVRAGLMAGIAAIYLLYLPAFMPSVSAWLHAVLLAAAAAVAVLVARRIPSEPARLLPLNRKLNLLLVPVGIAAAVFALVQQVQLERGRPSVGSVFAGFDGRADASSPDVWHLILDRYASSATLAERYRFDNRPFLAQLRRRGFAVSDSYSNYQRTAHSVASTLNGAYLDSLGRRMADRQFDWVPIYRSMTSNEALRFFEGNGYRTVFAGSWWNPTRRSAIADENLNYRALSELGRLMLDQSAVGFVLRWLRLPYGDSRAEQCRRAAFKFAELRALAASDGHKYVFAHFLVPHPPFVLNPDGSCRSLAEASAASRRDNYVAQVQYANGEMLRLIDSILAGPRPAAIVIHSDEGPWPEPHVGDERFPGRDPVTVDWARLSQPQLEEKMGIMIAIRPADSRALVPPASPVNVYPSLLRTYFGGRSPLLPDRHFVFAGDRALYTFQDVGPRLRGRTAPAPTRP